MREVCAYLGRISYPTYLFHFAIIYALAPVLSRFGIAIAVAVYLMAAVVVTTLFFYGFEKLILASRPRYGSAGNDEWHAETAAA